MTATTHSLISPSNFERRMLCPGSFNAEKDLPDVKSKYAEEGNLLHAKTVSYIKLKLETRYPIDNKHPSSVIFSDATRFQVAHDQLLSDLTDDQKSAVKDAANYVVGLIHQSMYYYSVDNYNVVFDIGYEVDIDLSCVSPGMRGTADTVIIFHQVDPKATKRLYTAVHVIDYKFGKGVAVSARNNYQLMLYALGVINDTRLVPNRKWENVGLHIVQPYLKNSYWGCKYDDYEEFGGVQFYKDVVDACYDPNAKRIPHKKACRFCKAKPTCPALSKTIPNLDNLFELSDSEIAAIYDNKELIKLYLFSIEDYIMNRLSTDGFEGYELINKLSNRKWNQEASEKLPEILGENAFEITKKLISIGKAEKLLGKTSDVINNLTTKEVTGTEIIKIFKNN